MEDIVRNIVKEESRKYFYQYMEEYELSNKIDNQIKKFEEEEDAKVCLYYTNHLSPNDSQYQYIKTVLYGSCFLSGKRKHNMVLRYRNKKYYVYFNYELKESHNVSDKIRSIIDTKDFRNYVLNSIQND